MRLIDADDLTERAMWYEAHGLTLPIVHELISSQDTVDAMQWIPVSERLPENEKWVIVSFYRPHEIDPEDGYEYDERRWTGVGAYFEKLGIFHAYDDLGETGDEVIAWMPLPEPYKEERDEDETD